MFNMQGYRDKTGGYVPKGRYDAVIEHTEVTQTGENSQNPGTDMINVYLRVQGGEYNGVTLLERLVASEKALFKAVMFADACRIPRADLEATKFAKLLQGHPVSIDVDEDKPYQGRSKCKIVNVERRAGGAKDEAADEGDDELATLAAQNAEPEAEEPADEPDPADEPEQEETPDDSGETPVPESSGPAVIDLDDIDLG